MAAQPVDDTDGALQNPVFFPQPLTVIRTVTSTGARISTQIKAEEMTFDKFLKATNTKVISEECLRTQMKEEQPRELGVVRVKEEPGMDFLSTGFENKPEVSNSTLALVPLERVKGKSFQEWLWLRYNTRVKSSGEYSISQEKEAGPKDLENDQSLNESSPKVEVKEEPYLGSEDEVDKVQVKEGSPNESRPKGEVKEVPDLRAENEIHVKEGLPNDSRTKVELTEEPDLGPDNKVHVKEELPIESTPEVKVIKESDLWYENRVYVKGPVGAENKVSAKEPIGSNFCSKPQKVKTEIVEERVVSGLVEDGDFPEDPEWFLVGRTIVTALSTSKGRKLVDNEVVHFAFSSTNWRHNAQWIVRFSTKRSGEIGRLPMEWGKCVVPLVNSSKVKVLGRCVAAPSNLSIMQEIMLCVSFYIHHSIFTKDDASSWRLDAPYNIDSTLHPLLSLFKLLKIKPYQKAEFTPEELHSRKRVLNLDDDSEEAASMLPIVKRRKGCQQYPEQSKDEQALSESSLNKLVGAEEMYNLEEMEPPYTLMCDLRPYQKQALYWMLELEKGIHAEKAAKTLHPCWAAYQISDERASSIYVNTFSGESTTKFPTATQMARGGILADAMGLGKTVMTIALILARPGRGCHVNHECSTATADGTEITKSNKDSHIKASSKANGGTLIVCPMALLGQWKDELETHSKPESISIFVHYGGSRASPKVIAEHNVVLTTYGVLTAAYKNDSENSIFHRVSWYRVVLDEAHTIKSWKTQGAQAAFSLSSHCRWCLTGTPIQNNLEDLYSLLCFLHVEPWCNWAWWNKLIQKPYENGDPRGMKLIKAILRPLMLRRTKESKDKEGRPILVLPPTDIQIIECEQSEAEHDFYDALFKRSKVQFDQFVAQGKVLHNYANILELLLRLRQCCNHPFLVMSRADSQKYTDLSKLARRFLETNSNSTTTKQTVPTHAYVEEVVEGIRRGENTECPICLEYADDPVLTPCAHKMCRECLLSSWRTPTSGLCPICRQLLKKIDLIACPSENQFWVDVEKNWKESSKVSGLLECLERIKRTGSGEKSIVFSQWTSFFDLLEIPLKRRGIGFLRFDGKLVQKQREWVLKEFSETKEKMVLLMSLRAGGVGLNLTAASNVFLMDPWWNPAVEEQAIMRIHRIGQKRTVCVRRFIVKDTVEERMQQVQARKQRMIAGALTDQEVRTARLEELKMLFR
ncbi:DNA repair protein RAD5B [Juglans microcarpa x Juglans regia]|uniref:DNA repair protein RAD5B n=1 Tax=Juglans microcarpa x Juglans regia TaxID=2249226 RepID=UPI001B7E6FF6|nr:DNA repair protein RAD5B [Juglans microcarpa x Juglans regia]